MNELGFWVGLAVSIPLSILANILTPRFQRALDARSQQRAVRRTNELRRELDRVRGLAADTAAFHSYLLWIVLRTTLVGSLVAIIAGLAFMLPTLARATGGMMQSTMFDIGYAVGQGITLFGSLTIVNMCREGLRTYYRVKDLDSFSAQIEAEARELS